MKRRLTISVAAFAAFALGGVAVADLLVKDGAGTNATMFDFLCFTTKHCSASVLVTSAGVEIAPATAAQMTSLIAAVNGAIPAGSQVIGYVNNEPCQGAAPKLYKPLSITTATTTVLIAGTASKKTYICHLFLTSAGADNVGIVEGSGTTCGTSTLGIIGGATAANGPNFPANGGMSVGNGGYAIAATTVNQNDVCLITSAATPLAVVASYVQQ